MSNGGTVEAPQGLASPLPGDRMAQLKELYTSMTASKELVRVLATVLPPGALNPTAASLLTALRSELDVARARARQIARDHRRCHGGSDEAAEQVRDEVRAWKIRHREKAAAAARLVASELDAERRARQRAERVGKKLGDALAEAEAALREARREVERERKARARVEKVCDELAAAGVGVGGEEGEEEMRWREAEREDLEREREMLRVADELREERVRMKLAEARIQFEEKNVVVDQLRRELEAFLGRDCKDGPLESPPPARDDHHRLQQLVLASSESVLNGIDPVAIHKHSTEEDGGYNSDGSDIELNVDGNSRDYSWSYSTAASNKETTAEAARNAASQSSQHGSFFDRGTDGGAFDRQSQGPGEALEPQHWNDMCSDDDGDDRVSTAKEDMDEDAERYEAIKNLREQMLAGHGFVFVSSQQGEADADDRHHHRHEAGFVW